MSDIPLKEYIERIFTERDARYVEMFRSNDTAVRAALAAQEKQVNSAFEASEKAIVKAETAQTAYNLRSNEFRASLDDQAKLLLTRTEADVRFQQFRELADSLGKEIIALRLAYSQGEGGSRAAKEARSNSQWVIGLLVGIALATLGYYISSRK